MNGHLIVYTRLTTYPDLVAAMGTRTYVDVLPESPQLPAITYTHTGGDVARGAVADSPYVWELFQVTIWAASRIDARKIANLVKRALERLRKTTVAGIEVGDCFLQSDVDLFDFDTRAYYTALDFKLHYRNPA